HRRPQCRPEPRSGADHPPAPRVHLRLYLRASSSMRAAYSLTVLLALTVCGQSVAVDLSRIDRSLRKEPAYQSKVPQYALLVFGPQAKVRVWVVLDGDVLYLDRNGNGDLTDPGERITAEYVHRRPEFRPGVEILRNFDLIQFK